MSPSPHLTQLVAGDRAALDRFYREHARKVLDWVWRLGGRTIDAEDTAHDVFAVAFKRIHTYDPHRSLDAWLYGVTRRVVANARRRAAIRQFVGLDQIAETPEPGPDAEAQVMTAWRRDQVRKALDRLKMQHREVVVLMDLEGRSAPEVSEILDVAVGTVYSRLHYGRKAFKDALQEVLGGIEVSAMAEALGVVA